MFFVFQTVFALAILTLKILIDNLEYVYSPHNPMSIVYITMECVQVIPDLYIIYVILILFLYFKDLKIKAME